MDGERSYRGNYGETENYCQSEFYFLRLMMRSRASLSRHSASALFALRSVKADD